MSVRKDSVGDHAVGVVILGLLALLLLVWAPAIVGTILMLLAPLVVVLGGIGLLWPSLMRLPNRLASVWIFTAAVGMFLGGGMLISPQNGEGTASDAPVSTASAPAVFSPNGPIVRTRVGISCMIAGPHPEP